MIDPGKGGVVRLYVDMAAKIGLAEALLLSQIDYWLERTHRFVSGHFWVYNTLEEWGRQLSLSPYQVKKAACHLEKMGLIERRRLNRAAYDRTLSYTICYDRLREMGFGAGRRGVIMKAEGIDPWDRPESDGDFAGAVLADEERTGADKWAM